MTSVDRIAATIRREYPHHAHGGTFRALFRRHDAPASIVESPSGPPIAVDIAVGDYTFGPDGTALKPAEFDEICHRLDAMAARA